MVTDTRAHTHAEELNLGIEAERFTSTSFFFFLDRFRLKRTSTTL